MRSPARMRATSWQRRRHAASALGGRAASSVCKARAVARAPDCIEACSAPVDTKESVLDEPRSIKA